MEKTLPYEPRGVNEVPILLFALSFVREGCIVDGWVVQSGFYRGRVGVNAGEVVVLVDAKDVSKKSVVICPGPAPHVCAVLDLTC